jgi:hypothetical protein
MQPSLVPPLFPCPDGFTIEALRAEDWQTVCELSAQAFTQNNPLTVHLGITPDEWQDMTRDEVDMKDAILHSLVARRDEDGVIAAYLTCSVFDAKKMTANKVTFTGAPAIIVDLVEQLYDKSMGPGGLNLGAIVSGRCLHIANGGTNPSIESKGLGSALRSEAVRRAVVGGKFTTVIVEPGHPATCHIWLNKLNFRSVATILPSEFKSKGGKGNPLEGLEDAQGRVVMAEFEHEPNRPWTDSCWCCCLTRLMCQVTCRCC